MKYQLVLLFLFCFFSLGSCSEKQEGVYEGKKQYLLKLAAEQPNDIFIEVTDDSSLMVMRCYMVRDSSLKLIKYFPKLNGELYERVFFTNKLTGLKDSINLLMLSIKRDTSYEFEAAREMMSRTASNTTHIRRYIKIFPDERGHITEVYSRKGSKALPQRYVYDQNYTLLSFTSRGLFSDTLVFRNQSIPR